MLTWPFVVLFSIKPQHDDIATPDTPTVAAAADDHIQKSGCMPIHVKLFEGNAQGLLLVAAAVMNSFCSETGRPNNRCGAGCSQVQREGEAGLLVGVHMCSSTNN